MMIHLESGTCDAGVDQDDIDGWALECYTCDEYINDWDDEFRFRCPTCQYSLPKVSSLFQHTETQACDASYTGAIKELQQYVKRCIAELLR